ncbi:UNVERIFIED_CONTAM: hypothetical protein GTU68_027672 [Idotea baltica]|nr:hypothetical protein [Idotea baltica]
MNILKTAKNTFRKEMKQQLSLMSIEDKRIQSEAVTKKLLALPEYRNSKRISVYLSMQDEIQTENILKHVFNTNKACFIPRYDSSSNFMDMVRLYSWSEFESLPETRWKIKQPPLEDERETALSSAGLDLILIPGLAFTSSGKRMGRGRGYYDTYLAKCFKQQLQAPMTIALAYKQQIVPDMPTEETDVLINKVLIDD